MNMATAIILVILVVLAASSGAAKIALLQQEVEFFGKYGFTTPVLIAFGAIQLLGGVLLALKKTRFFGAAIVGGTFLVSLVLLVLEGDIPVSIITLFATLMLGIVMKQNWKPIRRKS